MQSISPCLWFDRNAQQAVDFYLSVFKDGEILSTTRYGENAPLPAGSIMTITFLINGMTFIALNGGPYFTFSPAISLAIHCTDQAETDYYWERLRQGGRTEQCGWLRDRFGVSWQVVPTQLMALLAQGEPAKVANMTAALLQMKKLDMARLIQAYES